MKIKSRKTENRPFAEFKYLEKNKLYGIALDKRSVIAARITIASCLRTKLLHIINSTRMAKHGGLG